MAVKYKPPKSDDITDKDLLTSIRTHLVKIEERMEEIADEIKKNGEFMRYFTKEVSGNCKIVRNFSALFSMLGQELNRDND